MKIVRVVGQCIKFGNLCRKKEKSGQLTPSDVEQAEKVIIKQLQQKYPPTKHTAKNLNLVFDDDGLIRMQSRIQHCGDSEFANPIFLPDCAEAKLLNHQQHQTIMHGGPKATLTKIREKY
uniref:Uncharacterized protein n=1 Tax=Panagrolaimus davidi TaxID=227884 RepID=A0A914PXU9_9BILA